MNLQDDHLALVALYVDQRPLTIVDLRSCGVDVWWAWFSPWVIKGHVRRIEGSSSNELSYLGAKYVLTAEGRMFVETDVLPRMGRP